MATELKACLKDWIKNRISLKVDDMQRVFICIDRSAFCDEYYGKPFKKRQHFMKRLCMRAGVKPFGFHSIRHLTASILYKKGYSLSVIQSILRHKSPNTTARYIKSLGLDHVKEALEEGIKTCVVKLPIKKSVTDGGR